MSGIGITSVGVCLPKTVRSNDYYINHPSPLVRERLTVGIGKIWNPSPEDDLFSITMGPYQSDPFRGAKYRRVLERGQTILDLEREAALNALRSAQLTALDIDALIVTSFISDHLGVGNAAYLAKELGTNCPAWNIESACSSANVALEVAYGLIHTGAYKRILVVQSCNYSQTAKDDDPSSWFVGDGAGAMLVSKQPKSYGFLGFHTTATTKTCGLVSYQFNEKRSESEPKIVLQSAKAAGKVLHEVSESYLEQCCFGVLNHLGLKSTDVNFYLFSTPTRWYSEFGVQVMGVPKDRTLCTHERYGNAGPAMMPINLHEALAEKKIREGDLVLVYLIGSVSNASAMLMRWHQSTLAFSEI